MIDINKIKYAYNEYLNNLGYYRNIDQIYSGKMKFLREEREYKRSNEKQNYNFIRMFTDEEANYAFGVPVTYSYDEDIKCVNDIKYIQSLNDANHDAELGRLLSLFTMVYEISYINSEGDIRQKIVTPLNGNHFTDDNDDMEFFIYVHKKKLILNDSLTLMDYIDVYDNENVYYYDSSFNLLDVKQHNFGCIPVGCACFGGKYTVENGYRQNNNSLVDILEDKQNAYSTIQSIGVREISDFNASILCLYGIELQDKLDKDGNPILDEFGNKVKIQPVLSDTSLLNFADKNSQGASWLLKDIPTEFIEMQLKQVRADIYSLANHIDTSQEIKSNVSGAALRGRLFALTNKCIALENAMKNLLRTRLKLMCKYLALNNVANYDYKKIGIKFTANVPQDLAGIADALAKIDHGVLSNYTKRQMLAIVDDPDAEQMRIDKENEKELLLIDDLGADEVGEENNNI